MGKFLKLILFVYLIVISATDTSNVKRTLQKKRQRHDKSHLNSRVLKGRDLAAGEYPYVIILVVIVEEEDAFQRTCTGSMITATWGITASHCLQAKFVWRPFKIYVAYDNFTESPLHTGLYVPVVEMFLHPTYRVLNTDGGKNDILLHNDVGLFRSENVPKKTYAVLSAADYTTLVGLPVEYVGAGRTNMERHYLDGFRPMQVGTATVIKCDEKMRSIAKIVICLASKCSERMQTPWYGDSGGPLIHDGKIIGVCSYIIEHTLIRRMGYVPVSPYIDWIFSVVNGKNT